MVAPSASVSTPSEKRAALRCRLEHERGHGADHHGLGDMLSAVAADLAGDLAASRGMADLDRILQLELLNESCEIVSIGVEIITVPWLARAAMAATIMGDAAIAMRGPGRASDLRRRWRLAASHG